MDIKDTLIISKEFTDNVGGRDRTDGEFSGQEFLEDILESRFKSAVEGKYILCINLNGVWGYPSSFTSGSFGRLSVQYKSELVLKHITFESTENPFRIKEIEAEIRNPTSRVGAEQK